MFRNHLWKKVGTNEDGGKILRIWSCQCGESKKRVTRRADSMPRQTHEHSKPGKECCR